jgi:two-component system, OmpR family, alkaline phosphatase synthesis response regulator PhoP
MFEKAKKVFVVDDEPQIVKVLKAYLEKAGYQVITASDGHDALSVFRREKPDFLILDLNLPGVDGLDICKAIRLQIMEQAQGDVFEGLEANVDA